MNINERLAVFIKTQFDGNKRAFATQVGVSATLVENIVGKRQSKPSFGVTAAIYTNVNISAEWLLTGQGPMLRDNSTPSPSPSAPEPIDEKSRLRGRIEQLECENERLRVRNEELISEAAVQKQEIAILRAQAKASAASADSRTA